MIEGLPRLDDRHVVAAAIKGQARQLRNLHASGESVASLCSSFNVSRPTVYRVLQAGPVTAS